MPKYIYMGLPLINFVLPSSVCYVCVVLYNIQREGESDYQNSEGQNGLILHTHMNFYGIN